MKKQVRVSVRFLLELSLVLVFVIVIASGISEDLAKSQYSQEKKQAIFKEFARANQALAETNSLLQVLERKLSLHKSISLPQEKVKDLFNEAKKENEKSNTMISFFEIMATASFLFLRKIFLSLMSLLTFWSQL